MIREIKIAQPPRQIRVAKDGTFASELLPAGSFGLTASMPGQGHVAALGSWEVAPKQTRDIGDLVLPEPAVLEGVAGGGYTLQIDGTVEVEGELLFALQEFEALCEGLHHAILDPVVDHLHKVTGSGWADVSPAGPWRRRQ